MLEGHLKETFPKDVKLGSVRYKIEEWDHMAAVSNARWGEFSPLEMVIRVDLTLPLARIAEVLLHEILHAVWYEYELKHEQDDQERIVTRMGTGLSAMFYDNPHLVDWFKHAWLSL